MAKMYGVSLDWFFREANGAQLAKLAEMITKGTLKPVIDSTFTFADSAKADDKPAARIGLRVGAHPTPPARPQVVYAIPLAYPIFML